MQIKKNNRFLIFSLLILSIFSVIRLLDDVDYWIVDIFSHFPVQYAFGALLLLAACLWKRVVSLAFLAGLLFAVNISVLVDPGSSAQAAAPEYETFTVYSANISKTNTDFTKLVEELRKPDADILLLLEATEDNIKYLQTLIKLYPYHIVNLNSGSSGTGTVLMSKFQIVDSNIEKYSEFGNMLVSATLKINNKRLVFYGTHFPRPLYMQEFSARSEQVMLLAQMISKQSVPVIVAGDLNATPYSPAFRKLLEKSGLKDSREGFGWQPSWPAFFPFLWLPIDHILVSPEIQVHNRATGSYLGSDHYPVFAELSIN